MSPEEVLRLLGEDVRVLGRPRGPGEGDYDCAVSDPDRSWPLRLTGGWRLCQRLHQDVGSWSWILERDGNLLAIETLDDPRGLGRDGFRSGLAFEQPADPVRAAYLATKRIRKGDRSEQAWRAIGALARREPERLRALLAPALAEAALRGEAPSPEACRHAVRARGRGRLLSPVVAGLQARRILGRIARPTGLVVVVAGPDGSGKSTLARELPKACGPLFRRSVHLAGRPGILPRPGSLLRRPAPDSSRPHERAPHNRALSAVLLVYYWLDFLLGAALKVRLARARSALVVIERGWWDLLVDPRRYRLSSMPRLTRVLGYLLPAADLLLFLEAAPKVHADRKAELPTLEVTRQLQAWREAPADVVPIDASRSAGEVLAAAREKIADVLHERAIARVGAGWVSVSGGRWLLPRGPRATAHAGLKIYQPVTLRSRAGWEVARLLAWVGAFRLFPRGPAPPAEIREAIAEHLPPRSTFALARGNAPGRFIALVLDMRGEPQLVAKLATTHAGNRALELEAEAISVAGRLVPAPLSAPRMLGCEPGLLLFHYVSWRPRLRPWRLPTEVARALGAFYAATGWAHGDCAPWNLLETKDGWTIVDWEEAQPGASPFADALHYIARSHTHLGRPSARAIRAGVAGEGWVGNSLRAYAAGAGLDPGRAHEAFRLYSTTADWPRAGVVL